MESVKNPTEIHRIRFLPHQPTKRGEQKKNHNPIKVFVTLNSEKRQTK